MHKVRVEQVICDGIGTSTADRIVYREFLMPFVPVVGMTIMEGFDWESGEIKKVDAVLEHAGSWVIVCYPEEDRRRQYGSGEEKGMTVGDIVDEYVSEGWSCDE
jgi:hypothetical protein